MQIEFLQTESEVRSFLKNYAPYSVIDRGLEISASGGVGELSRDGRKVLAIVTDGAESFQTKLTVGDKTIAQCSCSSDEDLADQWCTHCSALLWHAWKNDFLSNQNNQNISTEPAFRINPKTPEEIAETLKEAQTLVIKKETENNYRPSVRIELEIDGDQLGVRPYYDEILQSPEIIASDRAKSSRALDNLLLQLIEDEASFDESSNTWFITSSHGIDLLLGVLPEYKNITNADRNETTLSRDPLNARIKLEWQDNGAEITLHWILPNGSEIIKESNLIGTGPFWTGIDNTLYKLSPLAAQLTSIFPFASNLNLNRSQVSPLLELLTNGHLPAEIFTVLNPKKQPETETKNPKIRFVVQRLDEEDRGYHGAVAEFSLKCYLIFDYPQAPAKKNIIFLPNRELEQETKDLLKSLGFEYQGINKTWIISGDAALDLVHRGPEVLPKTWQVEGLEEIKSETKFSNITLSVNVTSAKREDVNRPIDWFDCSISLSQNNANIPISMLFKNLDENSDRWIRLDNGAFAQVPGGGINSLKTTLGILAPNFRHAHTIKSELNVAQAVSLARFESANVTMNLDKRVRDLGSKLQSFKGIEKIKPCKTFTGELRSYQQEGLSWLNFLKEYGMDGILADEMGLGKTVQTLALIQSIKEGKSSDISGPVLVVAPTSVTMNWIYEARRFTPKLKSILLHGAGRKKLFSEIATADIVVTSYALLRQDRPELEKHEFSYIILDEAQNIKNPQTSTAKSAKALRSKRRLALSGTPTENRPLELWSIFDFLMPGYLGSYEFFRNQIETPILQSGTDVSVVKFLNSKTRPFILRRLKNEVEKDLPAKIESELHVEMTDSQKTLYAQILEEVRPKVFSEVEAKGLRGATVSILAALLRLRQVCNHPNSIDAMKEAPGYDSGKFELLKELLDESLASGRKILLFSQFREMLSIIKGYLESKQVNYLYLDGATKNRQDLVDKFNLDDNVRLFLISLKAGGTGLNLTAADTVIIYDPWWNPAVEDQAVDRAHRIGQTKHVNVYRLVTEDSIEQKIMLLKSKKKNIVDALINENGLSGINLSKADLESLFEPLPQV